jgi:hypothetical protein
MMWVGMSERKKSSANKCCNRMNEGVDDRVLEAERKKKGMVRKRAAREVNEERVRG